MCPVLIRIFLGFCVTRLQLLVFWTKFSAENIPLLAEEGGPRHQKQWIRSDLSRTGWSVRHAFEGQPNRARASRPSAPLLRLRPIGLALCALLCEEGNIPRKSNCRFSK